MMFPSSAIAVITSEKMLVVTTDDVNYHLRKYTLASIQWNEFFNEWYNETKTIIEITTSLKKLYPSNYTFKEREIRAWRAMLSHAGCTNITPYKKDISPVSYFFMNLNESINYNNLLLTSFFLQYEFWTRSSDPESRWLGEEPQEAGQWQGMDYIDGPTNPHGR